MSKLQYTEDRELLSKKIYDYCLKVEWEPNKLEEFAKELGLTITIIKKLAKEYAKKNLEEEEYKRLLKQINEGNKKENKRNLKLYIINPILLELKGKKTYYLWENDEEKELVFKYIYDYCGGINWENEKYNDLSKRIGFNKEYVKSLIKSYMQTYLYPEDYELLINNMIKSSMVKKGQLLTVINPILLEIKAKETYYLWENDEEKELVLKYIYDYCGGINWENEKYNDLSKRIGFNKEYVKSLVKSYMQTYLYPEDYELLINNMIYSSRLKKVENSQLLTLINPILLEIKRKETYYLWEDEEEKALVLKYIYDYCGGINWENEKYNDLSKRIGFNKEYVKSLIKSYMQTHLSPEDYELLINNMTKSSMVKKGQLLTVINPILLEIKEKETYYLWENDEEKELVLKYIYEYCEKNILERESFVNFAFFIGISVPTLQRLRKQYAIEYLKSTEEEYEEHRARQTDNNYRLINKDKKSKYKDILESLLRVENLTEIIKILDGENVRYLREKLGYYVVVHYNGNEEIRKKLREKINMYTNYISTQRKELKKQEQVSIAPKIVREFIDDDTSKSIASFCKKKGISIGAFKKYVDLVAENDFELFSLYNVKTTDTQKVAFHGYVDKIKTIAFYLENGIEEFGVVRQFDLIDYFLLTKMKPKDILCTAKNILSKTESNLLSIFFGENASGFNVESNIVGQIMSQTVILYFEPDKKGNPIPGTEVIFSDEEKSKIIDFLNENKIPLNRLLAKLVV